MNNDICFSTIATTIVSLSMLAAVGQAATAPTVALSANPTTAGLGTTTTLTWRSTNATSCKASGAWSGTEALSGSAKSAELIEPSTFTLTCTGTGGSTAATANVTVTPTLAQLSTRFAALQSTVASQATTISKLTSGATAADLAGTYTPQILQFELDQFPPNAGPPPTPVSGVRTTAFTGGTISLSADGTFSADSASVENGYNLGLNHLTNPVTAVTDKPGGTLGGTWSLSGSALTLTTTSGAVIDLVVGLGGRMLIGTFAHPGTITNGVEGLLTVFVLVRTG
jgi:hypothetical protein